MIPPRTERRWSSMIYGVLWYVAAVLFFLLFCLRTRGRQFVPWRGGVLFIANHQSYLDPPIIGTAVKRRLNYLAKKALFGNRFFARLIDFFGAIPINTDAAGKEGLQVSLALLQAGRALLVFPEGTRTPDGSIHEFKPGIVLLIRRARVPVVPVAIAGAFDAWPIHRRLPRFAPFALPVEKGTIAVEIGPPIPYEQLADQRPAEILQLLRSRVEALHRQAERLRRK